MRVVYLCTSGLDYPSPHGRWLPMARARVQAGDEPHLLLLHPTFDQLTDAARDAMQDGVHIHYVGQMQVYGLPGQRRHFGPLQLLLVSLRSAWALARHAMALSPAELVLCKPQPVNSLAMLWAAWRQRQSSDKSSNAFNTFNVDCDDYEAAANQFSTGWMGDMQRWLVQWCEDEMPRRAGQITVNTRYLYERYRTLGIDESRLRRVPNTARAIPTPDASQVAHLRAELGLEGRPVIAYVGTLNQVAHAVDLLLDALPWVLAQVPEVRLVIVGDGDDRAVLKQQAVRLNIAHAIVWRGRVPQECVPLYFALANCSVDPVYDTPAARGRSPLKIVESLAAGTPVVTGDVGDRSDMIGHNGVIVGPGQANLLALGIVQLLKSKTDDHRPCRL